jgi:hypothetical protein
MPALLTKNPKQFVKFVEDASKNDISFLEIPVVKLVINFKWITYTKDFFLLRFLEFILFFIFFILDIILTSKFDSIDDYYSHLIFSLVTRSLSTLFLTFQFIFELRQIFYNKIITYLSTDLWNVSDLLLIILYLIYLPLSFVYDSNSYLIIAI